MRVTRPGVLGSAREVPGRCPGGAREVPGRCPRGAREVPERFPGGAREVPERCPGGAREVPERCSGGVREVLFGAFRSSGVGGVWGAWPKMLSKSDASKAKRHHVYKSVATSDHTEFLYMVPFCL